MEGYVDEALRQGYIVQSRSPALASFFFIEKKGGSRRPYRKLNLVTVRYPHPLPLIPSAIEQLQGAIIFTRLDLGSAYNLVHIRAGNE